MYYSLLATGALQYLYYGQTANRNNGNKRVSLLGVVFKHQDQAGTNTATYMERRAAGAVLRFCTSHASYMIQYNRLRLSYYIIML